MTTKKLLNEILAMVQFDYKAKCNPLKQKDMPYSCKEHISRLITLDDGKKTKTFMVHISEVL